MEGSEHSDQPHKDVVLVSEENYKIQAYNVDFNLSSDIFADMTFTVTPPRGISDQIFDNDIGVGIEDRPGSVDPDPDDRRFGPQTNVPSQEVSIEDPNVPDSIPDGIY